MIQMIVFMSELFCEVSDKIECDIANFQFSEFPLYPNIYFKGYFKSISDELYDCYIASNYKDIDNIIVCKFTYLDFSEGIEILNVVESSYATNLFLMILFNYLVPEFNNVIIPIHKSDFKFLSKLSIFFNDNVFVELIKFDNNKFNKIIKNIFDNLNEDYKLILRFNHQYD